jgi:YVTN family beta-propeller protein
MKSVLLCVAFAAAAATSVAVETVGRQSDGSVLVPTNQVLRPAGTQLEFRGRPFDLLLSPDEKTLFIKNVHEVDVVDVSGGNTTIMQTIPLRENSFHGIALSADGNQLFVSQASSDIALISKDPNGKWSVAKKTGIPAETKRKGSLPGGLALTSDSKTLYAALNRTNALAVFDLTAAGGTAAPPQIPVGVAPYEVLLENDEIAYVSNSGGRPAKAGDTVAPSSGTDVVVDKTHFAAATGTVSVVDLKQRQEIATIEVGLHPTGMALDREAHRLYVANAASDTVSVVDTQARKEIESIAVRPEQGLPFGSSPNALTLSADKKTMYVANGANNCICVISLEGNAPHKVTGYIPTGWYPGAVLCDSKGTLYVANLKGVGSLAGSENGEKGRTVHETLGSLSVISAAQQKDLSKLTEAVALNNRQNWKLAGLPADHDKATSEPVPVPLFPGEKSVFKHVIYIIKENRTYDQVLGDMKKGNGDPGLCLFDEHVTPNHHALADEFTLLDNYYCSGIVSVDGHFWSDAAFVNEYFEKQFGTWARSYPFAGEDAMGVPTSGFLWDGVLAKGLTMRDYGEMVSTEVTPRSNWTALWNDFQSTQPKIKIEATANVQSLAPHICPEFPGFVLTISDMQRFQIFEKEFRQYEANNNFPSFIIMMLPGDHTAGTSPGSPTPRAKVADNDLALGKIVEAVSHSKFWPETCIFVSEDDPQQGRDHVDGHRTVGYAISAYTRRGVVDSTNYNQTGMVRTMELILGLDPMNQFDRSATPMANCFQMKPDLRPYDCKPNQIPLDEMNRKMTALNATGKKWARLSLAQDFSDADEADDDTLNRIIWYSVKGEKVPYPAAKQ